MNEVRLRAQITDNTIVELRVSRLFGGPFAASADLQQAFIAFAETLREQEENPSPRAEPGDVE